MAEIEGVQVKPDISPKAAPFMLNLIDLYFTCLEQHQSRIVIVLQCLQGYFIKQYCPSVMQES